MEERMKKFTMVMAVFMAMILSFGTTTMSATARNLPGIPNTTANVVTNAQIDGLQQRYKQVQSDAHGMAEDTRKLGLPEDSSIIADTKQIYELSQKAIISLDSLRPKYTDQDLYLVAAVITVESGNCSDRHQQLTGSVFVNRRDAGWADSLMGVLLQGYNDGGLQQYATSAIEYVQDAITHPETIPTRCINNAWLVLNGRVECPKNVLYQSEIPANGKVNPETGSKYYEIHDTEYSTTFFAYG
jgi:spore germination cell wall hydrolase CwlJ-like protein